jgi:hypothetical protein
VATVVGAPPLDYYLVGSDAIVVEEFVFGDDGAAVGLDSAGWTPGTGRWSGSAAVSRLMRADPAVRGSVVPVERSGAAEAYRRLGGGDLPDEATLRRAFHERVTLGDAPLRLTAVRGADGRESRIYRILFAGDLPADRLEALRSVWRMGPGGTDRVAGTARLDPGDDAFTWDLRRIGPGVAWCVDLTAPGGGAVGPFLRALAATARRHGLIPVTVERFS